MSLFTREAIRQTAWAALIAVVFVVLLPAAMSASRASVGAHTDLVGFSAICTLGGAKIVLPDAANGPDSPAVAHQQPCAFCTSAVPLFADAHAPRVVAIIDGIPVVVPRHPAELLPPDTVATQPLSPRAPPRI